MNEERSQIRHIFGFLWRIPSPSCCTSMLAGRWFVSEEGEAWPGVRISKEFGSGAGNPTNQSDASRHQLHIPACILLASILTRGVQKRFLHSQRARVSWVEFQRYNDVRASKKNAKEERKMPAWRPRVYRRKSTYKMPKNIFQSNLTNLTKLFISFLCGGGEIRSMSNPLTLAPPKTKLLQQFSSNQPPPQYLHMLPNLFMNNQCMKH